MPSRRLALQLAAVACLAACGHRPAEPQQWSRAAPPSVPEALPEESEPPRDLVAEKLAGRDVRWVAENFTGFRDANPEKWPYYLLKSAEDRMERGETEGARVLFSLIVQNSNVVRRLDRINEELFPLKTVERARWGLSVVDNANDWLARDMEILIRDLCRAFEDGDLKVFRRYGCKYRFWVGEYATCNVDDGRFEEIWSQCEHDVAERRVSVEQVRVCTNRGCAGILTTGWTGRWPSIELDLHRRPLGWEWSGMTVLHKESPKLSDIGCEIRRMTPGSRP